MVGPFIKLLSVLCVLTYNTNSLNLFAQEHSLKKKIQATSKMTNIDLNGDGKTDQKLYYQKNLLQKEEIDRNFDGVDDQFISYHNKGTQKKEKTLIKVEKYDDNFDGKIDHIEETYLHKKSKRLVILIKLDKDHNGIFEFQSTHSVLADQPQDDVTKFCESGAKVDLIIKNFSRNTSAVILKLTDGYFESDLGFKIHKSCIDNFGQEFFLKQLMQTMKRGLSCLVNLEKDFSAKNPGKASGALKNAVGLQELESRTPVSLVCSEQKNYDWNDGTMAHASIGPTDSITLQDLKVDHPFISLNPKFRSDGPDAISVSDLQKTLFHEHLHNLGHRHGTDVEYPYTCEDCCFPKPNGDKVELSLACKICTGDYSSSLSQKYIPDLMDWSEKTYNNKRPAQILKKYLAINPGDRWGEINYARATSGIFDPLGIALGDLLNNKLTNKTPEEQSVLDKTQIYATLPEYKKHKKESEALASAYYDFFHSNSYLSALAKVEAQIDTIASLVKLSNSELEKLSTTEKYMIKEIITKTQDLLWDIYIRQTVSKESKEVTSNIKTKTYELISRMKK